MRLRSCCAIYRRSLSRCPDSASAAESWRASGVLLFRFSCRAWRFAMGLFSSAAWRMGRLPIIPHAPVATFPRLVPPVSFRHAPRYALVAAHLLLHHVDSPAISFFTAFLVCVRISLRFAAPAPPRAVPCDVHSPFLLRLDGPNGLMNVLISPGGTYLTSPDDTSWANCDRYRAILFSIRMAVRRIRKVDADAVAFSMGPPRPLAIYHWPKIWGSFRFLRAQPGPPIRRARGPLAIPTRGHHPQACIDIADIPSRFSFLSE